MDQRITARGRRVRWEPEGIEKALRSFDPCGDFGVIVKGQVLSERTEESIPLRTPRQRGRVGEKTSPPRLVFETELGEECGQQQPSPLLRLGDQSLGEVGDAHGLVRRSPVGIRLGTENGGSLHERDPTGAGPFFGTGGDLIAAAQEGPLSCRWQRSFGLEPLTRWPE